MDQQRDKNLTHDGNEKRARNYACPVFSVPKELPSTSLPTTQDVMQHYKYVESLFREAAKKQDPSAKAIAHRVATDVISSWKKWSKCAVKSLRAVENKVMSHHKQIQKFSRDRHPSTLRKIEEYRKNAQDIFDVEDTVGHPALKRARMEDDDDTASDDESVGASVGAVEEEEDDLWLPEMEPHQRKASKRNMTKLTPIAIVAERFKISNVAAAAIASATLEAFNILTPDTVIDGKKIWRARNRARKQQQQKELQYLASNPIRGLFFDGKKDAKTYSHLAPKHNEEHVSMLAMPEEMLIGIASPQSGSAKHLAEALFAKVETLSTTSALNAVGCDGTRVNTGKDGGAIRLMEQKLGRPMQWLVCLLHTNELPLRHLFEKLDGKTTGPGSFTGPIGNMLKSCLSLPVVKFQRISTDLPDIDRKSLSTDQKYLLDMMVAISTGNCPRNLAKRQPGAMNHARWLTLANRILRLYIGTKDPSENLKDLVNYIMKVYGPTWFRIKRHSHCSQGAKNFFYLMEKAQQLPERCRNIVNNVLKNNAFFAHPENILLAMSVDTQPHVRKMAIEKIKEARKNQSKDEGVRIFKVPALNYSAKSYYDMIFWHKERVTTPPLFPKNSIPQDVSQLPLLPCHTQMVERMVKMVSEATATVSNVAQREGHIRLTMLSRKCMPRFYSKASYVPFSQYSQASYQSQKPWEESGDEAETEGDTECETDGEDSS